MKAFYLQMKEKELKWIYTGICYILSYNLVYDAPWQGFIGKLMKNKNTQK